jgi:regulator of PEP synthase PpsR (kinase-PPPase family)
MAPAHLHLVSDATGETVNSIARACMVQFRGLEPVEHAWTLVRTRGHMENVIEAIVAQPGPVLFTVVNPNLRAQLVEGCRRISVPCISILDPVIHGLAIHFGTESIDRPGLQHEMDAQYFKRIEAMDFTMAHDDGQAVEDLEQADIVLIGVSRTSKTPTCIYLANRGIRAANVPLIPGVPPPRELLQIQKPLVIGLTKDPARLVDIRLNRLRMMTDSEKETAYADLEAVRGEVAEARRLCARHHWPVIDVTRRSIEETAASILTHLARHREAAAT